MSISYTYNTLTAALQSYAEDSDVDYVANLDDFIAKAETRILRDLDLELFEQWLEITISGSDRTALKPTDVIVVNEIFIRDPSVQKWMELPRRSFEYCVKYAPNESVLNVPRYFSEFDETDVYIVPTPDISYAGGNAKARCTIRPSGLSVSNQQSWLSDNVGDLLFESAMIEGQKFLKHTKGMEEAATKYQSLLPGLAIELADITRKRYKQLNKGDKAGDD